MQRAKLVDESIATESVQFGYTVELEFPDGEVTVLSIRGIGESDPCKGVISYKSPVAMAMCGAREGETRSCQVRGNQLTVTVRRVNHKEA